VARHLLAPRSRNATLQAHTESMSTKTTIALALTAGFIGGIVSQRIAPPSAYAQAQAPIPREIRAESFVIVDENGSPRGAFGIDRRDGSPNIEILTDTKGHLAWVRWGGPFLGKGKSSMIPER
jgi:hypothetical protein